MSKAQLVITAVVLQRRSKSEVARDYGLSRYWVHQLVSRYHAEGAAALSHAPGARTTIGTRSAPRSKTRSCGYASRYPNRATTPAQPPSPNT
jgi:hypothetical protein